MKTLRERAEWLTCRTPHSAPCICAERVLRELVEEIAADLQARDCRACCGPWVRERFLAPRSPEEVVRRVIAGGPTSPQTAWRTTACPEEIIKALREEGMLKE